jgi:cell division protein FtsL
MEAFEYAIKKDIRNNAIVREIDHARHRELWRWTATVAMVAALLLCTAWQHFELLRHGYETDRLQRERREAEAVNRTLRLQRETLRSPQRIAHLAETKYGMVQPKLSDVFMIDRVEAAEPPAPSIVASR